MILPDREGQRLEVLRRALSVKRLQPRGEVFHRGAFGIGRRAIGLLWQDEVAIIAHRIARQIIQQRVRLR